MPRVQIPVVTASRAGVALTATAGDPVNNHYVANDGQVGIIVKNTGSTVARTVTFHVARKVDGFSVDPRTETLAAGEEQLFGPFDVHEYGSYLLIDVDNAELTIKAVKV